MNILKKLISAIRGGANEVGEAVVDTQAIRILEQEMRDARTELDKAKTSLTEIMAEKMGIERKVTELGKSIAEHEGYVEKALEKGDEALALEVAEKIADSENELMIQQGILDGYANKVENLKHLINTTERNMKAMEREISIVKTTEKVQKANEMASAKFSGSDSSLRSAKESLERITQRQRKREDQTKAAMDLDIETGDQALESKLEQAGILADKTSASAVLARIKAKK